MAKRKRKKQNYTAENTLENTGDNNSDLDIEKSIEFDTAEPVLKRQEAKGLQLYTKPEKKYTPETIFLDGELIPQKIEFVRLENGKKVKTACSIRQGVYEKITGNLNKSVNLSFIMFLKDKTIKYKINTKNIISIRKI